MKKKSCLVFGIFFALTLLMSMCFCCPKQAISQQGFSANIEDSYFNSESLDLISKNPNSVTDGVVENGATPFDPDKKERMEGACITPNADDCGQFKNKSFAINAYTPKENDSIFMWVYLIDVFSFKLSISIYDNSSSTLTWSFDSQDVYLMGTGWKFLQLNLKDFNLTDNYTEKIYSIMTISFLSESEDSEGQEGYEEYDVKTDERFSFYHVFASTNMSYNQESGKIYGLAKSFYEFSDEFSVSGQFYIGDSFKLTSPSKIFKYLYIGKYDLSTYSTSGKYYWALSLKNPQSVTKRIEFGDTIYFREAGYFILGIQLKERNTIETEIVLNEDISFFCDELNLGRFLMGSNYKIKDNEKVTISFKIASGITINGDYKIALSNNNAEIDSYYQENDVLYICVAGLEKGSTTLEVSANATSENNTQAREFSATATIDINSSKQQFDVFNLIIWVTFACFCVGIIIYLSISLVKARKNDVK